jgi:phosphatidylglycerol lysyltransferase
MSVAKYRLLLLWQFLFIVLSLSWLWAPWLNPHLSAHTSVISQFEAVGQPFSLLFRVADVLAALLFIGLAVYYAAHLPTHRKYFVTITLLIISIGTLLDPLFPTQCFQIHHYCVPDSASFITAIHDVESFIVYVALLALVVYDVVKRRKLPSITTVVVHALFGLYVVLNIPSLERYATVTQFVYELTVAVWVAWFCREILLAGKTIPHSRLLPLIRYGMAAWAFLMGVTAILINLTGGRFAFHPHALYLGSGAWLTQHGVIAGVILLYIGRHLLRGEMRARQLVLLIFGTEIIKYAAITPDPSLLNLYVGGFAALFVLRDSFDRGTAPLTWRIRLRDLGYLMGGLTVSVGLAAFVIAHHHRASQIAEDALVHLNDIVFRNTSAPLGFRRPEVLFSDTVGVLIIAIIVGVLWVLFKPSARPGCATDRERHDVRHILRTYSQSSEDFFKLWPHDKTYFWDETGSTFLAYRQVGPVAYLLADPVGAYPETLLASFQQYCRTERLKLACLPVYESSRSLYESHRLSLLQIGASAVIDITNFTEVTAHDKWWRWQRNRAEKRGYTHHVSMPPHQASLIAECKAISDAWLNSGGHSERGFALGYFDDRYLSQCVVHYLTDTSGTPVAFVNILPAFTTLQTATIDLLRFLPDHDGTMPYLLYSVIAQLKTESSVRSFDLGFVPFAVTDNRVVQIAKLVGGKRFSSKGLEQFKNKFDPMWEPNYLAYDGDLADLTQIAANLDRAMRLPTTKPLSKK